MVGGDEDVRQSKHLAEPHVLQQLAPRWSFVIPWETNRCSSVREERYNTMVVQVARRTLCGRVEHHLNTAIVEDLFWIFILTNR
jgi:hypothetical protein